MDCAEGREPPPAAMEINAEALFKEKVSQLPDGCYYPRRLVGLNLRKESGVTEAVTTTYHPDERVEILRRRAVQHEIVQAIGRGRGGNRTSDNPLAIDIISEVPLPFG